MTKLEKIAIAIAKAVEAAPDFMYLARAGVEEMRKPSAAMLAAEGVHVNCPMCGGHVEGWEKMIDAILSEKQE